MPNDIFGGQYTSINTNIGSTASANPIATTATTATTATGVDKNASSGLDSILNLANQGAQIAGSIKYQRQQSGASARRQSLISQCGRAPLFGRERKAEYRKCKADYQASLLTPIASQTGDDVNKNLGGGGSSMKFIWIGLAIVVAGGLGYMLYNKNK